MPKRKNNPWQERLTLSVDHAEVTADAAVKFFKVPAGRKLVVDSVEYINPTGLAEDAAAFFAVSLMNGAVNMATKSTDSAAATDASIAADTFTALTNSATAADMVAVGGDVLSLDLNRGAAAATLPAGRMVVHARWTL